MAARVFQGSEHYRRSFNPSPRPVVTIGNFDGVHRGHRTLIDRAVLRAREAGVPSCVYTFDPAPRDVLRPDNDIPRIQALDDKIAALGEAGIDQVVVEAFDRDFGAHEARWFADEILGRRLGASAIVVGWDFRFGHKRAGTVPQLVEWLDIEVEQVPPLRDGDVVISSSAIREAVRAGRVADATVRLGRPHRVHGVVVHGDARGRELGYPTANIAPHTELLPADGVYAVLMDLGEGELRKGMANLGTRPTFEGREQRLEVHLFDFAGDLYGRDVQVAFVDRIRSEQRFASPEALLSRLALDAAEARAVLA